VTLSLTAITSALIAQRLRLHGRNLLRFTGLAKVQPLPINPNNVLKLDRGTFKQGESVVRIRIATRGSKLAMWQANDVAKRIRENVSGAETEVVPIVTDGDRIQDRPLHEVEGKTLFIKEVEAALAAGRADLAVHCIKDYHPQTPPEFTIAAYPEGESERDLLITRSELKSIDDLPQGAVIGTTSQRRVFFLKKVRPDLQFGLLRGNIDTRLARLYEGRFDAIVLAEAGINRLEISLEHALPLPNEIMLPAVGQGALAIEVCSHNTELAEVLSIFNHKPTQIRVEAERAFISGLSANCKSAVGVTCVHLNDGRIHLKGHVGHPDTLEDLSGEMTGAADQARELGQALADQLLEQGAARLLDI